MWRFATALLLALIIGCVLDAAKAEEGQSPSPSGTNAAEIEETRSAMMAALREDRDRWRSLAEKSTSQEEGLVTETRRLVLATYLLAFGTVGLLVATCGLCIATKKVGVYTGKLVNATEELVSATDAVVKATEEHSRLTRDLMDKERTLLAQEHKRRTQMETYLAWKTVRTEIDIPSEVKMKAIVSNWKRERDVDVNERKNDIRERNDLRRNMRALEYFAATVNHGNGNTLDYELIKALAGSWILHRCERLNSFILLAREKDHNEKYWVEIENLGKKLAGGLEASTIEHDEEPE